MYEFVLKVTDSAEHTSTDSVLVVVKAQANTPPTGEPQPGGLDKTAGLRRTAYNRNNEVDRDLLTINNIFIGIQC